MKPFRCMKPAAITEADLDKLKYPVIVQPKYDGIRCVILNGKVLSGQLKPIPNKFIRQKLKEDWGFFHECPYLLDGELMLNVQGATFQDICSAVMSEDGEPDFSYEIFDAAISEAALKWNYTSRVYDWQNTIGEQLLAKDKTDVKLFESMTIDQGYEGIILRSPHAPYKFGRSTIKEGYLLKLKRFQDAEAEIIDCYPLETNLNEQETDERGLAKRSSAKSGKLETNMLGGFTVRGLNGEFKGVTFNIGSGFTENNRRTYLHTHYKGRIIKYKYQSTGSKDKPRCPIFLGFRELIDTEI